MRSKGMKQFCIRLRCMNFDVGRVLKASPQLTESGLIGAFHQNRYKAATTFFNSMANRAVARLNRSLSLVSVSYTNRCRSLLAFAPGWSQESTLRDKDLGAVKLMETPVR